MNYFGLFFSFMMPGIILGGMGAVALHQEAQRRSRSRQRVRRAAVPARHKMQPLADRTKLYVHDMNAAA